MPTITDDLLERDAELTSFGEVFEGADGGSGAVVVVEGQAGIGKSRLLGAARELAARRGHTVLRARGDELERDFAYGVTRQLFEQELTARDEPSRHRLLEGARRWPRRRSDSARNRRTGVCAGTGSSPFSTACSGCARTWPPSGRC